ncbi:MAG: nuclease-related domain-containing protein [Ilumatobacteraceae bacterium]
MPEFTEKRWTRYGKDRVYVQTPDGADVGHVDLRSGTIALATPGYESVLADCLNRWSRSLPGAVLTAPRVETRLAPVAQPAPPELDEWSTDFARNTAHATARSRINFLSRVLGVNTDSRAGRVGAKGEEKVERELSWLDDDWHVLYGVGVRGVEIDHVLVGPPGVIILNTKCHPKGKAWVGESRLTVNGQPRNYLRNSRHEAQRAERLLSDVCGFPVPVQSAIVFVDLDDLEVKQMPEDVHVTTRRRLLEWLKSLPETTDPEDVELIYEWARLSSTWL